MSLSAAEIISKDTDSELPALFFFSSITLIDKRLTANMVGVAIKQSHFAPQFAFSGESTVLPESLRSPFPEKIRRALNVMSETEDLRSAVSGIMSEHDHKDAFGAWSELWFKSV